MGEKSVQTVTAIDDEAMIRQVLGRALRRAGYRVVCVASPAEALELDDETKAATRLLLCDATVPDLDVGALRWEFEKHSPRFEFALSSGYSRSYLEHLGMEVEPGHFLQKPWTVHDLLDFVRSLVPPDA